MDDQTTNQKQPLGNGADATNGNQVQIPGIFIYKQPVPSGGIQVSWELSGGLDPLAAPSLVKLAHRLISSDLGLD